MIIRGLDENNDWTFGRGNADYLANNPAIALNIRTRILSWVNDCFFDLSAGIDWVNRLGSKDQRELLEQDLKILILKSFGVTGIISIDTQLIDRKFVANYSITTIYSTYQDTVGVAI